MLTLSNAARRMNVDCDNTLNRGDPSLGEAETYEFPFCLLTSIRNELFPLTVPLPAAKGRQIETN